MSASPLKDLSRCAIHTITTKPWSLRECIEGYSKAGIGAMSVWRNALDGIGAKAAGKMLRDAGFRVSGLMRGGFFTGDAIARQKALDENRTCIDEAREIN